MLAFPFIKREKFVTTYKRFVCVFMCMHACVACMCVCARAHVHARAIYEDTCVSHKKLLDPLELE